jgi:hypothetical protein
MEGTSKRHLYHMVPEDMKPNEEGREILYPLNMLKDKFPELYEVKAEKYLSSEYRKTIPEKLIPTLQEAAWGDVIQLTAIHPEDLKKALVEAGYAPKEMKFYQVDPDLLDPSKTTVYLYREDLEDEDPENFTSFDTQRLEEYSEVSEKTKEHYKDKKQRQERPFLFVGVPHIFHNGPIDVSGFPVITV